MGSQIDFDKDKCIAARDILGKNPTIRTIYKNNFSYGKYIGNCTELFRRHNPTSYEDFYRKYITYAKEHPNKVIYYRGLSYDELLHTAEEYKKMTEEKVDVNYDLSVYFYDLVCHIIIETYNGQNIERSFINYLTSLGYKCDNFVGRIDAKYGVDIRVTNKNDNVYAIQIKPISFFKSNKTDVQEDRISLCLKYTEAMAVLGIETFYAIYEENKETNEIKWLKNKNGFKFKINDLFEFDKDNIANTIIRKKLPKLYGKIV